MDRQRAIKLCSEIADDMKADAERFEGQPFNGKTVAEYFGSHGAAIAALAKIIELELEAREDEVPA